MKQLGVKHPEVQVLQISDLVECLGVSQSDLVRVALSMGLNQIKEIAAKDKGKAQEVVALGAFRVMQ